MPSDGAIVNALLLAVILAAPAAAVVCPSANNTNAGKYPPLLVVDSTTGFKSLNQLTLKLRLPVVTGRTYTNYQIGSASTDSGCVLSESEFAAETCSRLVTLSSFSWGPLVATCGFVKTTEGTVDTYANVLVVQYTETISGISDFVGQTRTFTADLLFSVKLDTAVAVKPVNVTVYDYPTEKVAVTDVTVRVSATTGVGQLTVQALIGVQKPLHLIVNSLIGTVFPSAMGTVSSVSYATPDSVLPTSKNNWLLWTWVINPAAGVTQFTEVPVRIGFVVVCADGTAEEQCPTKGNETKATIVFTLSTGPFTGQLVDTAKVTGTMSTYTSDAFSTLSSAYWMGAEVYGKVVYTSNQVSILSSELQSVTVGNASLSFTDIGWNSQGSFFKFTLETSKLDDGVADSWFTATVNAVFLVTYRSTGLKRAERADVDYSMLVPAQCSIAVATTKLHSTSAAAALAPWF
eukprot:m51a1_g2125 hypothetical protein (461) ;mRNA; f:1684823-1686205